MASFIYNKFKQSLLNGGKDSNSTIIDLVANNINVSLVRKSAYSPTQSSTDEFYSSVTSPVQEADAVLGSKSITSGQFDAATTTFTGVPQGAAIDALVIWKDTTVDATSPLICFIDGFSVTPNNGDITVTWDTSPDYIFSLGAIA